MGNIPKHIAIVMDGNGRWARLRKRPRIAGHRAGAKVVRSIVEACAKKGVQVLTLFALSKENLNRPSSEVQFLLKLFLQSLEQNIARLHDNKVRLQIIGDRSFFDEALLRKIEDGEQLTQHNEGLRLVVAINYSGRWDITSACQQIAKRVAKQELNVADITTELFQSYLCLHDLPEPDLLIRTSGEQRISNFMLWQFAYTEMYFCNVFWPDFNVDELEQALRFYQTRQRRFGLTSNQVKEKTAAVESG